MSKGLHEKQKTEAIKRLELMGVRRDVLKSFEKKGAVTLCVAGRYYPVSATMKKEIRDFEREHDATIYLVVRMFTIYATLDALLFVGKYEEDWEMELEDIKEGYAMAYNINRDCPECSEMGSIVFRTTNDGGIVREG